jgi:hypothetical protein
MKPLLGLLKVKHVQKKHWCDNLGWDMVEVVHTMICKLSSLHWKRIMCSFCLLMKLPQLTTIMAINSFMHLLELQKGPHVVLFGTFSAWF